jgi:hypothetical protein
VITRNESDLEGNIRMKNVLRIHGSHNKVDEESLVFGGSSYSKHKSTFQNFEQMKTRWFERVESASPVRLNSPYLMASFHDLTSLFFY